MSVSDFDYDPYTGYLCAAFKRVAREENVPTVACFDTAKYPPHSKPVFSAFPSLWDNMRPDQMSTEDTPTLGRSTLLIHDEDSSAFDDKPTTIHLSRLRGRLSRASAVKPEEKVVSDEVATTLEGNENKPHYPILGDPEVEKEDADSTTPIQRKSYNFVSVSKLHFDDCGRLWFFDCGTAYGDAAPEKHYRRPILWAFELVATEDRKLLNKLFLRYEILTNMTHNGISDFVVDIHGSKCDDFHVYLANHVDSKVIVYSHRRREDYAILDESLTPVKSENKHSFLGKQYEFTGGLFSLTLAELNEYGYRDMYYTLASGAGEYAMSTKTLRLKSHYGHFRSLGYRGCDANSLNHVYDTFTKVMFYMHPETNSVRCWNTNKRLVPENVGTLFTDDKLSTGWSMKIDQSNNLWFMANDFNFLTQQRVEGLPEVMNVFRAKVKEIIKDTVCEGVFKSDPKDDEETFDPYIDPLLEEEVLHGNSSSSSPVEDKPSSSDKKKVVDGIIL